MSSATIDKHSTTPKKQRTQSQQKERIKEDVYAQNSLPPSIEGRVYAILICHIPKLRWLTKYQSLCRSVTIKVTWWGEDDPSAIFKPHISGTALDYRQQPHTTTKYYIRCELKQFSKYLTDATELVFKVTDTETNRILGTVKIQNLSTLSVNNSIKGYYPIFSNKGDKLGELFISLRLFLPGPHDSNENLTAISYTSDNSNPSSRRNSIEVNDYNHQNNQLENGLRTYTLDHVYNVKNFTSVDSSETTIPFQTHTINLKNAPPGMKKYKELPTGKVVEELIDKANRLRENMIKSSSQQITPIKKHNHRTNKSILINNKNNNTNPNQSLDIQVDDIDPSIDHENLYDLPTNLNNSNASILSDLDGLENEQSLLDDLLYGGIDQIHKDKKSTSTNNNKRHSHGKTSINRSRSRSESSTRRKSNDSDIHNSNINDSGNETHDDEELLSIERIQLLNYVRTARIRIDYLRLNSLNDHESPSHSSFGRTNKSKRALTYYIEYQFPVSINNHINQETELIKITSKNFELNNDIIFSHLSTYSCIINEINIKTWWNISLLFKIYSRISGTNNLEQIGFVTLPFRNILIADYLHFEQNFNVIDCKEINSNVGQLHLMFELDSNEKDFKNKLDQIQLIKTIKTKKQRVTKSKQIKKSINNSLISNELSIELNDGLVLQIYLSIVEVRNLSSLNNSNQVRNPYFVCRAFWNEEPITSVVCWGNSTPKFNFEQKIPLLLTKSILKRMHGNFIIIELWDKKISGQSDQLIGIIKIPLEQFYISYKDKQISRVILRSQYPVISVDSWLPIIDPFTSRTKSSGEIQVLLAMGTSDQITAVQLAHSNGDLFPSLTNKKLSTISPHLSTSSSSSLIEHDFEIMIENINGLRAFESMIWGESDCFIQYSFPIQQDQKLININSIKPFQLQTIRTATTLYTSDPTFHDTNKFRYILSPSDALHKYFYTACQSTTPIDANIQFEVWSRFYHPNIRDQLLAKGKLSATKLCSMTTMLNSDMNTDDKSIQSFSIPLEIVRDDLKHEQQYHNSSMTTTYGGDLLLTVTYKRNIIKQNESQIIPDNLSSNDNSQVYTNIHILRACGLKYAAAIQAQHDTRFNYPLQVGLNTYVKLTCSFLSDLESRTTKTIARSFIPEFNQVINLPLSLIWSNHQNQSISLIEMLEHGDLNIEIYHQMNKNEKQAIDILLCYCRISLKELIIRQTGIKGWYPLFNPNNIDHYVGGIELLIHFSQQDDHRRIINSAKTLGWIEQNYIEDENSFENNLGYLVKISIDHIHIPFQLITQSNKDQLYVFAQYRFYDKIPIITKRTKLIPKNDKFICQLDFNKEHLFLYTILFHSYLREEKLEIQIWISENDIYDYSQSFISSNDKFLGSIYIDLSLLLNKQKNRFNLILPIFKQGTKDFHNACVYIQLMSNKSKDFNKLQNHDKNDIEFDSNLSNHYLNLINNDRALRTITNNIFSVLINIEQATHLPRIYSEKENLHKPPNSYVSFSTANSNQLYHTQVLNSTIKPQWNYEQIIQLSIEHLFNEKKVFILKIFHTDNEIISEKNQILGFISIDLTPLLTGLKQISGWYNIIDTNGNVQGQLKINIIPQDDLLEFKQIKYNNTKLNSTRSNNENHQSLNSSRIDESYLMNNLRRQLGELDIITEQLKSRYYSNSDTNIESDFS